MIKCMAYKAFLHKHTSELVHNTWSIFPQHGLTRQIQRRPSTKGHDLHTPGANRWITPALRDRCFDHQCLLLKDLQSREDKMKEKNLHILRYEKSLAYTWFNLNFAHQSSLFCGLSDMHCTSALAIKEENAFESQNGVHVVQTSKVKRSDCCRSSSCHFLLPLTASVAPKWQTKGLRSQSYKTQIQDLEHKYISNLISIPPNLGRIMLHFSRK